jgi:hypothetical protein
VSTAWEAAPKILERGKKIIPLSGNLVHEVAAEASQTLERLVEFIWDKRGREPPKAETLGNGVSIVDVALGSVGESPFESLDQTRVKSVDPGLEARKLKGRIEEATSVFRHGHIDTWINCFSHRHTFLLGVDGTGRQYLNSLAW